MKSMLYLPADEVSASFASRSYFIILILINYVSYIMIQPNKTTNVHKHHIFHIANIEN